MSLFIQTIVKVYRSNSKLHNLFFLVFISRILRFLGLDSFPSLELVNITTPIGATILRQRQAQMKSAMPSTRTSNKSRGEASTIALAFGDQPTTEEIHVDPTAAVDPYADDTADPIVTSPLSLHGIMETFMSTQAAHGQLIDELLAEVAILRVYFAEYRSAFPPPPPFDP